MFPTSGTVTHTDVSLPRLSLPGMTPPRDIIQVGMRTEPGFSGAPVLDIAKRVVGLVAYGRQVGS